MVFVLKGLLWHHTLFNFLKLVLKFRLLYMAQKWQKLGRKYHEILCKHWAVVEATAVLVSLFSSTSFFPILILTGGRSFSVTHCRICLLTPQMTVTWHLQTMGQHTLVLGLRSRFRQICGPGCVRRPGEMPRVQKEAWLAHQKLCGHVAHCTPLRLMVWIWLHWGGLLHIFRLDCMQNCSSLVCT